MYKDIDKPLAITFIFLAIFWVIMVSSVSVYQSYLLTNSMVAKWLWKESSNSFYFIRWIIYFLASLPIFFLTIRVPFTFWKKIAPTSFMVSLILLCILFIPWITNEYWSARSWIDIPFFPSIQPAEIMKIALVFYFSLWLESKRNKVASFKEWFLPFSILIAFIVLLIWLQPDFWAVLVICFTAWAMFFVWWWNLWHILSSGVIWILLSLPIILTHEYIYNRFLAFVNPEFDMWWSWYQIKQALLTIGSWKLFWIWFWNSVQKFWYLPEVQWDTIFAVAAEELWFIRITLIIACYLFIAYKWYTIANKTSDRFAMLLATWITSLIVFQAFINISVNLAIMPLTWITLPFVSYWGSSLITMMFAWAILLSISKYSTK